MYISIWKKIMMQWFSVKQLNLLKTYMLKNLESGMALLTKWYYHRFYKKKKARLLSKIYYYYCLNDKCANIIWPKKDKRKEQTSSLIGKRKCPCKDKLCCRNYKKIHERTKKICLDPLTCRSVKVLLIKKKTFCSTIHILLTKVIHLNPSMILGQSCHILN